MCRTKHRYIGLQNSNWSLHRDWGKVNKKKNHFIFPCDPQGNPEKVSQNFHPNDTSKWKIRTFGPAVLVKNISPLRSSRFWNRKVYNGTRIRNEDTHAFPHTIRSPPTVDQVTPPETDFLTSRISVSICSVDRSESACGLDRFALTIGKANNENSPHGIDSRLTLSRAQCEKCDSALPRILLPRSM